MVVPRTIDTSKIFDMMSKNDVTLPKYQLPLPTSKLFDSNMEQKIRNSLNASPANSILGKLVHRKRLLKVDIKSSLSMHFLGGNSSPKLPSKDNMTELMLEQEEKKRDLPTATSTDKNSLTPISATNKFPTSSEPLSLSIKSLDLTSKFIAPAPKEETRDTKKKDEDCLLDFSTTNKSEKIGSLGHFPSSPSVSVHITPSPLINPSPASSCITDDELMDEALVGLGK